MRPIFLVLTVAFYHCPVLFIFVTTDYRFIKVDLGISNGDFHLNSWLNTDGK